jgi:hypothetical protein
MDDGTILDDFEWFSSLIQFLSPFWTIVVEALKSTLKSGSISNIIKDGTFEYISRALS